MVKNIINKQEDVKKNVKMEWLIKMGNVNVLLDKHLKMVNVKQQDVLLDKHLKMEDVNQQDVLLVKHLKMVNANQ